MLLLANKVLLFSKILSTLSSLVNISLEYAKKFVFILLAIGLALGSFTVNGSL